METRDSKHYRDYYMYKARNTVKTVPKKKRKIGEREIAETANSIYKNLKYVNSKRKSVSDISELHTEVDGTPFVASTDPRKQKYLQNFSPIYSRRNKKPS